jgi:peptidoglycan/xylan/chitin deacetylase (PgdA/CDA1 family)
MNVLDCARRIGVRPMVAGFALAGLALSSAATAEPAPLPTPTPAPACWTKDALAAKSGEEKIQKWVARAFVEPPPRTKAAYADITPQVGVIRRVKLKPGDKRIALTFDLCEQPDEISGYQGTIVDFLRQSGTKATFFMGGKWMLTHRERAQQLMSDALFEVGNHTWEHHNLRLFKGRALIGEIRNAQLAYQEVRGELETKQCTRPGTGRLAYEQAQPALSLFRFPFGACDGKSLEAVAGMGLQAIQWDVSAGDPSPGLSAAHMAHDVLEAVHPGSIVLFHANGRGWRTPEALPDIVAHLKAQGYTFVTVSQLMAAGEPEITDRCYDVRPGDADKYDAFARRLELQYQRAKAIFAASAHGAANATEIHAQRHPALQDGVDTPNVEQQGNAASKKPPREPMPVAPPRTEGGL